MITPDQGQQLNLIEDLDKRKDVRESFEQHNRHLQFFVDKPHLWLKVEVNDLDSADQILEWMYAKEKPVKAELLEINWGQSIGPQTKTDLEAIRDKIDQILAGL